MPPELESYQSAVSPTATVTVNGGKDIALAQIV